MKFKNSTISLKELVDLISKEEIDLKPYYQRNDIWSKNDQKSLIDSIISGYPLPSFFVYRRKNGRLEMVDGQQRSRTIYRFFRGVISSSENKTFQNIDQRAFLEYPLSVTEIEEVDKDDSIEDFYVLVNKKGKHLNTPELHKAEYADSIFLRLVEDLLENQNFIDLNLFTEATSKRMNDRAFVEELIAYLYYDITDKRTAVLRLYDEGIQQSAADEYKTLFNKIIDRIKAISDVKKVSSTRYRQRNDFYTLFNFIHKSLPYDSLETNNYHYRILLVLDGPIRPTIEDCDPLRNYAINCVSQSNSKRARKERLSFFQSVLQNTDTDANEDFQEVYNFLIEESLILESLVQVAKYELYKIPE